MLQFFCLERDGLINLKGNESSSNQCAAIGHQLYKYKVAILFPEGINLDSHGFLIDNNLIDQAIQKVSTDSCEIMLKNMMESVYSLLEDHDTEYIGIKMMVWPVVVVDEKVAQFTLYHIDNDKYVNLIFALQL